MSEIRKQLDANIPESAVQSREQAGRSLSYLSGAYVIKRLNEVLGQGNWDYRIDDLKCVYEGKTTQTRGEVFTTSYIAQVQLRATIDGKDVFFTDVGYGDGTDFKIPGKAHELAVKEAVTDGIKRAAKNLGISMGLGLYFKDGEYVTEEKRATVSTGFPTPKATVKPPTKPSNTEVKQAGVLPQAVTNAAENNKTTKPTKQLIKGAFGVLKELQKITAADFTAKYLSGSKVDALTDEAAIAVYTRLKTDFKELKLN